MSRQFSNNLKLISFCLLIGFTSQAWGDNTNKWNDPNSGELSYTGKAGIGTTAPKAELHVNDTLRVGADYKYPAVYGELIHKGGGTGFKINANANGGWADLHLQTDGSTRIFIESKGKVGIGTGIPDALLHVDSPVYAGTLFEVSAGTFPKKSNFIVKGDSGNVGIGTKNPTQRLHVKESLAKRHPNIRIEDSKGDGVHIGYNTSGNFGALNSNTSGIFHWDTLVWKDGKVGIGTQPHIFGFNFDPQLKLDVQGMIRVANVKVWDGPGQYDLTWAKGCHESGSSTVCGFLEGTRIITRESSSRRYKQNIRPLDHRDIARIMTIEAKQYEMKKEYGPSGWSTIGYLAEDLHEAGLSDLVIYDEQGKPDGVKYKKIALYVNEVVKSQQKIIQQLQTEVEALKKRMEILTDDSKNKHPAVQADRFK